MTDHLQPSDPAHTPDQWDAVARFLAGEASAGEAADLRQWLSEHPDGASVIASLDTFLPPSAQDAQLAQAAHPGTLPFGRPIDVESALRRVHAQMDTTPTARPFTGARVATSHRSVTPPAQHKFAWSRVLLAAAALAIAAVGVTRWQTGTDTTTVAVTYNTPVGSSDSISLADGSKVILAAGSRLIVAADYGKGQRNVELLGAGHFTVRHDEKRPFSVSAGSAVVRDLGTTFTVKAVDGAEVVVAVTEGSVSLRDSSASHASGAVNLQAGDRGRLRADGTVVSEQGSVTPDEAAWVVGKLVYRDAPLDEVQADLRRWYGVELVVADSALRALSVNTEALTSESARKVVDRIAKSWGAVVTSRADTLFVDRSGDRLKH